MTRSLQLVAMVLILVSAGCSDSTPAEAGADANDPGTACPTDGETIEDARLYIEHNATDEDTGVHGSFGGDGWSILCLSDPSGAPLVILDPAGELDPLGIADLFFESREPTNDEFPVSELEATFPEGEYTVGGIDVEGGPWAGKARFTHAIPAEPEITMPGLSDDEDDTAGVVVARDGLEVRWLPVTETIDGEPVEIVSYEVIVTKVDHDDPDAVSQPVYDVHVGPDVSSLPVVAEFLEPDTIYELEVLAIEASGNQTIALGFFATGAP